MSWRTWCAVLLTVAAAGCSRQPAKAPATSSSADGTTAGAGWSRLSPAEMTPEQKALQERCVKAVRTMGQRLLGELEGALDSGDPAAGIEICRTRAPEIAAAVSNEFGVRIGRTSFKLRNPANAVPEWAEELVSRRVADPTWLRSPEGRIAGLMPIRLKAECGMCHGPEAEIPQEVRAKLAESYPNDQATGFHAGDLRGWFWVETAQNP